MNLATLKAYWAKVLHEAKGKLSTYVAAFIGATGELRNNWDQVQTYVPHWPWAIWLAHHIFLFLGVLVIYARIRRALKED